MSYPRELEASPTCSHPFQRGKHVIQFKDDTQVLEDSDGIALAKKSKSGLQGDLRLQLQGAWRLLFSLGRGWG